MRASFFGAFLLSLMLVPVGAVCAPGKSIDSGQCRNQFLKITARGSKAGGYEAISAIKSLAPNCSGTWTYNFVLANAYLEAGHYTDAEKYAANGLSLKDANKPALYYIVFRARAKNGNWVGAKNAAEAAVQNNPESGVGYLLKGEYLSINGNFPGAIHYLEKSIEIRPFSATYQQLVVAYYNTNQFLKSTKAFESSEALDETAIYDKKVVLAASASYYETDRPKAALELLNRHAALMPESRKDQMFKKMYALVATP